MLNFLLKMTSTIKVMVSGKLDARLSRSTGYIANAFHRTLHAVVYIIKKLLDMGFDYVLFANSLSMQRLKLYNSFDIQQSNDVERPCCIKDVELNEDDIELIENCFTESSCFSEEEL